MRRRRWRASATPLFK